MNTLSRIENIKRSVAEKLNKAIATVSQKGQKRILIVAGCSMAIICLTVMIEPFRTSSHSPLISTGKINPVTMSPGKDSILSHADYQMIVDFKQTMDSLKLHDLHRYHQILQGRSGLLDSIDFIIKLMR